MEGEATEIEITPAMIQAGFLALCNSGIADEILEADRVLVAQIFQAMVLAHRQEVPRS
jgi:hypothetical protein